MSLRLEQALGPGALTVRRLGGFLKAQRGRSVEGHFIQRVGRTRTGHARWTIAPNPLVALPAVIRREPQPWDVTTRAGICDGSREDAFDSPEAAVERVADYAVTTHGWSAGTDASAHRGCASPAGVVERASADEGVRAPEECLAAQVKVRAESAESQTTGVHGVPMPATPEGLVVRGSAAAADHHAGGRGGRLPGREAPDRRHRRPA